MKRFACLFFVAIAVLLTAGEISAKTRLTAAVWRQYKIPFGNQLEFDYYNLFGARPNFYLSAGNTTALMYPDVNFVYEEENTVNGEKVFVKYLPGFSNDWNFGYHRFLESELKAAERRKPGPQLIFEDLSVVNAIPGDYSEGKTVNAKVRFPITDTLSVGLNVEGNQLDHGLNPVQRAGVGSTVDLGNGWKFDLDFFPVNFNPLFMGNQPMIRGGVRYEF